MLFRSIKKFPNLPRFGSRASTANSNFLNPDLFERQFLNPLEPHRSKVGPLIFEICSDLHFMPGSIRIFLATDCSSVCTQMVILFRLTLQLFTQRGPA